MKKLTTGKRVLTSNQGKLSSKRMPESAITHVDSISNGGDRIGSKESGRFRTFTPRIEGVKHKSPFGGVGK